MDDPKRDEGGERGRRESQLPLFDARPNETVDHPERQAVQEKERQRNEFQVMGGADVYDNQAPEPVEAGWVGLAVIIAPGKREDEVAVRVEVLPHVAVVQNAPQAQNQRGGRERAKE